MDFRSFLLYTAFQERIFRSRYAAYLKLLPEYEAWFYTFPLYEWHTIQVPLKRAEFTIGMLCLLMRSGKGCFSIRFPSGTSGIAYIQRFARDEQEFQEYLNNTFNKNKHYGRVSSQTSSSLLER